MVTAWRTIRVFVSSTFRDMQAERDHLVRFGFARLREELLKRRFHLMDVDIRWGVPAKDANGETSGLCSVLLVEAGELVGQLKRENKP